ncbi:MAG: type II CAAX endopeptidase family protein [Armatimonadota bacterium]|nr:type II CAAX endopeptidase family protein [Armatimonadota bacterium]
MATGANGNESVRDSGIRLSWREQLYEVSVFLLLIVPSMVISLFAVMRGHLSFPIVAVSTMIRDLAFVALILFFVWRNGEPLERIGWSFRHRWRDIILGIVLFIPFMYISDAFERVFQAIGLSAPSTPTPSFLHARGSMEFALATVLVVVVALSEETIFRGYLIQRFAAVTHSTTAAVFLSAFIFSLGHGYEGSVGVATVGVMGVLLALVYIWRRSLVAPIVIHFLQDFLGIVLLPLLGMR